MNNVMDLNNPEYVKDLAKDHLYRLRGEIANMQSGTREFDSTWELIKILELVTN